MRKQNTPVLFAGLAVVAVAVATLCLLYANLMQATIQKETERYLAEITEHVSALVEYRVESTFKNLEVAASTYLQMDHAEDGMHYLQSLAMQYHYTRMAVIGPDCTANTTDGLRVNLSGYHTVWKALWGQQALGAVRSLLDGKEAMLYLVPLYQDGEVVGALGANSSKESIGSFLNVDSFAGEGFSRIIDQHGDYVVNSSNQNANEGDNNFFHTIERNGQTDGETDLEQMKEDILEGRSGLLYYTLADGTHKVMNYVPLSFSDWYLLSAVPTSVTLQRIQPLVHLMLGITCIIVGLFVLLILLMVVLYQKGQKELERLAYVDLVTGGLNRTKFELEAKCAIRSASGGCYALVSADIQKFKLINEAFGSMAGNRALKHVHDTMAANLEPGELVARISADTFNLLLRHSDAKTLVNRLSQMADQINAYNDVLETKYFMPLVMGIYIINNPDLELVAIQDRATVARKKTRWLGENRLSACAFYADIERKRLLREKDIANRMDTALEKSEFVIYLQPKVSLQDDCVQGAEALVRWLDPERGLIPPNEFIPVFEQNGFITRLDLYVFEGVCKLLRHWIDTGLRPVPIAVNLSRVHFGNPHFLDQYQAILDQYHVSAQYIEMELTETLVLEDLDSVVPVINRMHAMGFRCALDDFGSGYSSLNALKDIPADVLKLDKAFFDHPDSGDRGERVVESVIELARKLDMETVSEGIEQLEQLAFLRQAHCDMIQGYIFSRPVPIADFEALAFHGPLRPACLTEV